MLTSIRAMRLVRLPRAATRAAAARIANAIRAIKRDENGPTLQKEFFENAAKPTATKQ